MCITVTRYLLLGTMLQMCVELYVRIQWELEADNEFTMAMGVDTALPTQN